MRPGRVVAWFVVAVEVAWFSISAQGQYLEQVSYFDLDHDEVQSERSTDDNAVDRTDILDIDDSAIDTPIDLPKRGNIYHHNLETKDNYVTEFTPDYDPSDATEDWTEAGDVQYTEEKPMYSGIVTEEARRDFKLSSRQEIPKPISPYGKVKVSGQDVVSKNSKRRLFNMNTLKNETTSMRRYRKGDMFVIDETDSSDADDVIDQQYLPNNEEDLVDEQADRKGSINRGDIEYREADVLADKKNAVTSADEIVIDEENPDSNAPPGLEDGEDVITDSMLDGTTADNFETNQIIRSGQEKGKVIPMYLVKERSPTSQFLGTGKGLTDLLRSGFIESPPDQSSSVALRQATEVQAPSEKMALTNVSLGDFASIVEEANKFNSQSASSRPMSAISTFNSKDDKLLESVADSLIPNLREDPLDYSSHLLTSDRADFDVQPNLASLSKSEQQLIASLDNAARTKDLAAQTVTQLMMPTKEDITSDRTVAPPEQLLDMLAKGKFTKPLPDNVLSALANYDANKLYLKDEGMAELDKVANKGNVKFMKVGPDVFPVQSVAVNMPRTTVKPLIDPKAFAAAEAIVKTDPHFIGQNLNLLDATKYRTLQDLQMIGTAVFPGHIVNVKQPETKPPSVVHVSNMESLAQSLAHSLHHDGEGLHQSDPLPHPSSVMNHPAAHELQVVSMSTDKLKPPELSEITNFEDALLDSHANDDAEKIKDGYADSKGVPELHGRCHWNPCMNGGQCTAKENGYKCMCKEGYIGINCERHSNCVPNPCHHGTCSSNEISYVCTCKYGYKGTNCDVLDKCTPNPCHNNGECTATRNEPMCSCLPGYKGAFCELESKCAPVNPCMNGGLCQEFVDHYHCMCRDGYVGQNCETFAAPTTPPVTLPSKQEGPQVIPPPANQPANELHQIVTTKHVDSNGNLFAMSHEIVSPGMEGVSNPGAALSPHPQQGLLKELHIPSNPHPGDMHSFVGAPSEPDRWIIHTPDEDRTTSAASDKKKQKEPKITTGKDDRYQTHFVETNTVHSQTAPHPVVVGTQVESTKSSKASSTSKDAEEDLREVVQTMMERTKKQDQKQTSHQSTRDIADRPMTNGDDEKLAKLFRHQKEAFEAQSGSLQNADATFKEKEDPVPAPVLTERGDERSKVRKTQPIPTKMLKVISKGKNPLKEKQDNLKVTFKNGESHISPKISMLPKRISAPKLPQHKANLKMAAPGALQTWWRKAVNGIQSQVSGGASLNNTFFLRSAKALEHRGRSSVCPAFCKAYCDPWCASVHCCKISPEQMKAYKMVEMAQQGVQNGYARSLQGSNSCSQCDENAQCTNNRCVCNHGFHGDGRICTVDPCLLCHLDALCVQGRCACKPGFVGDGYECNTKRS